MEWIQFIQEVPALLAPLPLSVQGEIASQSDRNTWFHALVLQCCYCAELNGSCNLRSPNQMKQWILTIAKLDVGILGKHLKMCASMIRHYPSEWDVMSYNDFKDHCEWSDMGLFFSPVKDYFIAYLANPSPETLSVLLQWTCFLTRITLETGFTSSSKEFLESEERLKGLVPSPLWDDLRDVLYPIASTYHADDFRPVFSSGANADSPKALGLWGKVKYGWSVNPHQRYLLNQYGWAMENCPEEEFRCCRLVFVPKGIDSRRAICEEPSFSMFLQQGVLRNIDRWFSRDPLIGRYINLHDQEVQRSRARHASVSLNLATLDLSAASDSVCWRLVEHVFHGSELFEDLFLTRTESVLLPEGETIKLEKFAPMGSALCFPVECLIFLGICLLGCKRSGARYTIGVYGDDLIVPVEAEDEIVFLLTQFGFIVNTKKSFWGYERFKESCGGEYMDGVDVTPLYIPRNFKGPSEQDPQLIETYTDLSNSLFQRTFRWMRRYLLSTLLLPNFPGALFSTHGEGAITSMCATNYHLRERWNWKLQRLEVRHQCLQDDGDEIADDEVKYFLTLLRYRDTRRCSLLFPEDEIRVKLNLKRLTLGWRWAPKEDSLDPESIIKVDGSVTMLNY